MQGKDEKMYVKGDKINKTDIVPENGGYHDGKVAVFDISGQYCDTGETEKPNTNATTRRAMYDEVNEMYVTQDQTETHTEPEDSNTSHSTDEEFNTVPTMHSNVMKPPDGGWGWLVALGSFINTVNI